MSKIIRTDSNHRDFINLVRQLDKYLELVDGDDHEFYDQFNHIEVLDHVVLAYKNDEVIGCGALKVYDDETMEIKRMFTLPKNRGKGVASAILLELEKWTQDLSFPKCILETGRRQIEAIELYKRKGYRRIPNYGPYEQIKNSLCFEKQIT